jgi:hypothetical protein
MKDVALLFLAHDGLKTCKVWQEWLEHDQKMETRVVCFYLSNQEIPSCSWTWLGPVDKESRWGSRHLVQDTLRGLSSLLRLQPSWQCAFLVSGTHVPVVSCAEFMRLVYQNQYRSCCACDQKRVLAHHPQIKGQEWTEEEETWLQKSSGGDCFGAQWCCFSRSDAEEMTHLRSNWLNLLNKIEPLVNYKDREITAEDLRVLTSQRRVLDEKLVSRQDHHFLRWSKAHLDACQFELVELERRRHRRIGVGGVCPDEWYLQTILHWIHHDDKDLVHQQTTFEVHVWMPHFFIGSPVLWTNDAMRIPESNQPHDEGQSFRDQLRKARQLLCYFFRKVIATDTFPGQTWH